MEEQEMKCRYVIPAGVWVLLLLLAPQPAAGQTLVAETTWGGTGAEFMGAVATGADGSAYAVGTSDSFAVDQFGQPTPRIFVVKFAPGGSVEWQRIWNGPTQHVRPDVAVGTDDSVFVAGLTNANNGDAVLLKFDTAGNLLWERTWGGPQNEGVSAVAAGADGSVYIAGTARDFNTGSAGLVVVKFDGGGNLVWQRISDGATGDAIAAGPDGSVYAAGSTPRDDLANFDVRIVKLTAEGDQVWQRTYSAGEVVDVRGRMAAAPDGSIVLAGAIQAEKGGFVGIDPLIVKLDQDGNLVFNRVYADAATAEAVTVAPDDGSIYVAGTTTTSGTGFQEAFVLHLQSTGKKVLDSATWGGAESFEEGLGVAVAGGTVVLGATTTTGPPYSLLEARARLSTPKSTLIADPGGMADAAGTASIVAFGVATPGGSTTYQGNFEAAVVRILR
jgi:hypothetical protein